MIPKSSYDMAYFMFLIQFDIAEDGGILVNDKMETSIGNVYAAGDVCTASWKPAPHWLQVGGQVSTHHALLYWC